MLTVKHDEQVLAYIKSLDFIEEYAYYNRPLVWLSSDGSGGLWLGVWQGDDEAQMPHRDQDAFLAFSGNRDELEDRLKNEPLLDVLKSATRVLIHDHYYVPFSKEGNRDEGCEISMETYLAENEAQGMLPKPGLKLFSHD